MKASKLLAVLFASLVVIGFALGVAFEVGQARAHHISMSERFGVDGLLRLAEIKCAHFGVNSFHIWNRDTTLPGFCPLNRPDKPQVHPTVGESRVHAYPVWHNAYFYFLGWLSPRCAEIALVCLLGLGLFYISKKFYVEAKDFTCHQALFATGVLMLAAMPICCCFLALNYSVFVFACWLAVAQSIKQKNQVWAGILWGVAMIKPQMALLLFWPLVFSKRYLTIITAVITCVIATICMSIRYGESFVDLILQIPQIGAPYTNGYLQKMFGPLGLYLQPGTFFVLCGWLSYLLRKADKWFVRFAPAALCTVSWTYCLWCDRVVLCIWFCVIAYNILGQRNANSRWWIYYGAYTIATALFVYFWEAFSILGLISTSGLGWIYYGVQGLWLLSSFFYLCSMIFVTCHKISSCDK